MVPSLSTSLDRSSIPSCLPDRKLMPEGSLRTLPVKRRTSGPRGFEEWMELASCRDHPEPTLWFPTSTTRLADVLKAKAICSDCPVRIPCKRYGTRFDLEGIWGGQSRDERRRNDTRT